MIHSYCGIHLSRKDMVTPKKYILQKMTQNVRKHRHIANDTSNIAESANSRMVAIFTTLRAASSKSWEYINLKPDSSRSCFASSWFVPPSLTTNGFANFTSCEA
eukprot:Selendium_serpulae@DN5000_c0_g2_i3.p1